MLWVPPGLILVPSFRRGDSRLDSLCFPVSVSMGVGPFVCEDEATVEFVALICLESRGSGAADLGCSSACNVGTVRHHVTGFQSSRGAARTNFWLFLVGLH